MENLAREKLKRKAAPACLVSTIVGILITIVLVTRPGERACEFHTMRNESNDTGNDTQHALCSLGMTSGITELYEDVGMVHSEFKQCAFDVTRPHQNILNIHQMTIVLDHGANKDESFYIYFDAAVPRTWGCKTMTKHVRHLFKAHTKTFCNYPFAFLRGYCILNGTRFFV